MKYLILLALLTTCDNPICKDGEKRRRSVTECLESAKGSDFTSPCKKYEAKGVYEICKEGEWQSDSSFNRPKW
jgi:hypothetical protein